MPRPGLLLVFEAELQLDAVLHDLAALDAGGGLDHFHRADVPDGLAGQGYGLAGGVAS